jgi:hypothetical protein
LLEIKVLVSDFLSKIIGLVDLAEPNIGPSFT